MTPNIHPFMVSSDPEPGRVYFARCATRNLVKIGWCRRPFEERRCEMRQREALYYDIEDAYAYLHGVSRKVEHAIHAVLRSDRVEGELFRPSPLLHRIARAVQEEPKAVIAWLLRNGSRSSFDPSLSDGALLLESSTGSSMAYVPDGVEADLMVRSSRAWPIRVCMPDGRIAVVSDTRPFRFRSEAHGYILIRFVCCEPWLALRDPPPWADALPPVPNTDLNGCLRIARTPPPPPYARKPLRPLSLTAREEAALGAAIERLSPEDMSGWDI